MSSSASVLVFNGSVIIAHSLPEWVQTVTSHDKQDIQQRSVGNGGHAHSPIDMRRKTEIMQGASWNGRSKWHQSQTT